VSPLLNLTCLSNKQFGDQVAFTFCPCMDVERSRVFASFMYGTMECFIRWDLSGSIPEVGVLEYGLGHTNNLGGAAMSESYVAIWRYQASAPEILVCPI
jgi:hypothetical protein